MIPIGTPKNTLVSQNRRRDKPVEYLGEGKSMETFMGRPAGASGKPREYRRSAWQIGGWLPRPEISPPAKMSQRQLDRMEREKRGIPDIICKPHVPIIVRLCGGTGQAAADATDATLKALPMSGNARLERDADGRVKFNHEGLAVIWTSAPGFVEFAVKRQGYVAEVVK